MTSGEITLTALTILAILAGPIVAVWITRRLDDRRLKQTRRMDVFRTLMRTRRVTLSPDHVGALNLVEIEFQDEKSVIDAWRQYFESLGARWPNDLQEPEIEHRLKRRSALLTKLLHAMATALDFEIEQLDIFEGGYAPQGWQDDEQAIKEIRYRLLQLLNGNGALPITSVTQPSARTGPYPPPP